MDRNCLRTMRNFNTVTAGVAALQLMGPNPYRWAMLLSPVANQLSAAPITAAVFTAGANQLWTVPNGVTSVLDAFVWGSSGNSGAAGAVLGGGGGGGGGFDRLGPATVVPGTQYRITVDAAGGAASTKILNSLAQSIAEATSGTSGVLDAAGTGGSGTVGIDAQTGSDGIAATLQAGKGGGGGAAGGVAASGGVAANQTGGIGGGSANLGGYGVGGSGGTGGQIAVAGTTGTSPGGAPGGSGKTAGAAIVGQAGLAVIFYQAGPANQAITIDQDPNLILLEGAMNWLPGATRPFLLRKSEIGDVICDPWYVISGVAAQRVSVTEYSYVPET